MTTAETNSDIAIENGSPSSLSFAERVAIARIRKMERLQSEVGRLADEEAAREAQWRAGYGDRFEFQAPFEEAIKTACERLESSPDFAQSIGQFSQILPVSQKRGASLSVRTDVFPIEDGNKAYINLKGYQAFKINSNNLYELEISLLKTNQYEYQPENNFHVVSKTTKTFDSPDQMCDYIGNFFVDVVADLQARVEVGTEHIETIPFKIG